jgi:hypothetical protein
VLTHNSNGLCHLSINPVTFGKFDIVTPSDSHPSTNHEFPCYAQQVLRISWAVYSFGGGHFAFTISTRSLPFCVKLACNQYDFGRALFRKFTQCMQIFKHGKNLLNHFRSSGDCSQIHGYLIHSCCFWDSDMTLHFWQMQKSIVAELRAICSLQVVVAIVIPDHNGKCVKSFYNALKSAGWCLSLTETLFPIHGNTILGSCRILIGIHTSCAPTVEPPHLKSPPPSIPRSLGLSLWEPFNRTEHSVLLAMDDIDFMHQDVKFTVMLPHRHSFTLLVSYSSIFSMVVTRTNLCSLARQSSPLMVSTHLLTRAQIRICSNICLALNSIRKTTHASVAFCNSNLHTVLASSTTSPTVYHNQQTNSAWTLPFPLVPWHGSSNKSTSISHLSEILTVKFSLQIHSQCQLQLSRPLSRAL